MGVSTIHLSELIKLLLMLYTACPCLLFRYEATISFVMCLSVFRPHGTRLPMEGFS